MKKTIKLILGILIVSSFVINPYKLNLDEITTKANSNITKEKASSSIVFVTTDEKANENLERIKKTKKDDSLNELREKIKTNKLNAKVKDLNSIQELVDDKQVQEAKDLAVHIKDVKNNIALKKYLNKTLKEGKRVFLYGDDLTATDYKETLNLNSISVSDVVSGQEVTAKFGLTEEEIEKEKGPKKQVDTGIDTDASVNVIGYTLDDSQPLQYIQSTISSYDEKGNELNTISNEIFLQEILLIEDQLLNQINPIQNDVQSTEVSSVFDINKASAASTRVQDKYGFYGTVYFNSVLFGRIDTDYELYKQSSDSSSTYDYFTAKPRTQVTEYNGSQSRWMKTDIDIPYDSDHLQKWSPEGDKSGTSYSLSISAPYGLSWTMNWDDSVNIDDQSSIAYDYARWVVTDGDLQNQLFKPGAGWASSGTLASATIRNFGRFYTDLNYYVEAKNTINISYNY